MRIATVPTSWPVPAMEPTWHSARAPELPATTPLRPGWPDRRLMNAASPATNRPTPDAPWVRPGQARRPEVQTWW